MTLRFNASNPKLLLKKFEDAVAQKLDQGNIDTWRKVPSGNHSGKYTHVAKEWTEKAYFVPEIVEKTETAAAYLIFKLSKGDNGYDQKVYGYYHGHLLQAFISHFPNDFDSATSSTKFPAKSTGGS